jgi:hypothetical protein
MPERHAVQYQITPAAYSDAVRLHRAGLIARYRIAAAAAAVLGIGIGFAFDMTVGLALTGGALALLLTTWMEFLDRWIYRDLGHGVMGALCKIEADDHGLHYEHPLGSGVVRWSALTAMRFNERSIVFVRDRVLAAYVPTGAFASPVDREAFIAFAQARLPSGPGDSA